ncbi:U3 small nucleolar RNA-associated protein 18 homolog [Uranotaenia lowii]|uniref:U3 small nucleolar RNA-associated protein 18 homolog n=1 Tax=Uranotaenia lowii TaxID=190385 RepID=UPI0024792489|nr:U3 small nucleolar RNA-associated protein 18 homolog [Uranotaenia lowii]
MSMISDEDLIAQIMEAQRKQIGLKPEDDSDGADIAEESSDDANSDKEESESTGNEDEKDDLFAKLEEQEIDKPKSDRERNLMSRVFGGRTELVSSILKDENSSEEVRGEAKKRSAAWHDSDDEQDEDFPGKKHKTELRATVGRRRKNFEKIVGKPKWADLDREKDVDSDDEVLRTVGHVVKGTTTDLPQGQIELKRLKNLNRETKNEGDITAVLFHPTSMVAIMTGMNGIASIVAVDGTKNEKLHTIGLKKFKIACCGMSSDGNEIILGSYRKFYHTYNLLSGQSYTLQIKDELWTMKNFEISKCGKYIAVTGGFGEIHLLDGRSKELIDTIQQNYACPSLCFTPDSKYLIAHSNDTMVSIYHLAKRRFVNVFTDDGCVNGSFIIVCPNNRFLATGNRQGIVNIYLLEKVLKEKYPTPERVISNLTTAIGSIAFNCTSELMAIASPDVPDAIKLIHLKSGTVYRNFPMMKSDLGRVTRVQFSPGSGYLAVGSREGFVSLFRVKHYQNY